MLPTHQRRQSRGDSDLEAALHSALAKHLVYLHRGGDPLESLGAKGTAREIPFDQPMRGRADDHRIGLSDPLHSRSDIRGITQSQLLVSASSPHLTNHHLARVHPNAHLQWLG